ncbi:MAG: TraR/DksA family transcriptional regulator, DnaK suppressor protein [Candidatus Dadabacteria bacterium CSP1-2]|nr:MAG: TraR/DksA family transcriptional regulator, DnaK suppressor protein [Candidatus Dadabacteria bacterium CSP1-2]
MKGKKKKEKKNKKKVLRGKESYKKKTKMLKTKTSPQKTKKERGRKKQGGILLKPETKKTGTKGRTLESPRKEEKPKWMNEIKDMLIEMRKELLKDVSQSAKMERDYLRFDIGDFYDHASSDRDRELMLTLTDRERDKLVLIDEALRRIKDGNYGICENCGDEIGEDRLRAMPFAKFCLSCKIDLERQESRNI